jgi:hypothetical protein
MLCATMLGLLCISGEPLPVVENPSPRLVVEQHVEAKEFSLSYLRGDNRISIDVRAMHHVCKDGTCIFYDVQPLGCAASLEIYPDQGRLDYEGGDYYTLKLNQPSHVSDVLSRIQVRSRGGMGHLLLAELPTLKIALAPCS